MAASETCAGNIVAGARHQATTLPPVATALQPRAAGPLLTAPASAPGWWQGRRRGPRAAPGGPRPDGSRLSCRIELPRSSRRYRFSMTAMADMMFQLLVFFMLSTNVVPYSLLDVAAGRLGGTPSGTPRTPAQPAAAPMAPIPAEDGSRAAIWTLRADGAIISGGQEFPPERLPDLADALVARGTPGLLVVLGAGLRVQGVVAVLETLAARGVPGVRVVAGATP